METNRHVQSILLKMVSPKKILKLDVVSYKKSLLICHKLYMIYWYDIGLTKMYISRAITAT